MSKRESGSSSNGVTGLEDCAADNGASAQKDDLVGDNLAAFSQLSVDTTVHRTLTVQHDLLPAPVYKESSKPQENRTMWHQ